MHFKADSPNGFYIVLIVNLPQLFAQIADVNFKRAFCDLVLLDLMLPGLSGEEVLPKIKDIPVIVVSAKVDVEDKVSSEDIFQYTFPLYQSLSSL